MARFTGTVLQTHQSLHWPSKSKVFERDGGGIFSFRFGHCADLTWGAAPRPEVSPCPADGRDRRRAAGIGRRLRSRRASTGRHRLPPIEKLHFPLFHRISPAQGVQDSGCSFTYLSWNSGKTSVPLLAEIRKSSAHSFIFSGSFSGVSISFVSSRYRPVCSARTMQPNSSARARTS